MSLLLANRALDNKAAANEVIFTLNHTIGNAFNGIQVKYSSGSVFADWGDGSGDELLVSDVNTPHAYTGTGVIRQLKLKGDLGNVTRIYTANNLITAADNLKLVSLTEGFLINVNQIPTLDLSETASGSSIWLRNNTVLNTLSLKPSGNSVLASFLAQSCPSLKFVDFTVYPTSNNVSVRFDNNGLTATEHDNQLINLDNTGWINGTLNIITGNTARTAASDTAYNNLISNGWTIT